ncbi:MAG: YheU family protein [Cellvibrionaceae bacterium]
MIIPHERLAPETLKSLIESFITREGTDYGFGESSLESKVDQVAGQIQKSEVVIVFDDKSDSINLLPREDAINWKMDA